MSRKKKKSQHNPWVDMNRVSRMLDKMASKNGATIRDLMRTSGRSMATVYRWLRLLPDLVGRTAVRRRVGRVFRWTVDP